MYLLCLRSPRCDFELIFIVYLVGDVAARHPSPRVHQLGDPSNSIWSYSRKYNTTRYEQINLHWLCTPLPYQKQITLCPLQILVYAYTGCFAPQEFPNNLETKHSDSNWELCDGNYRRPEMTKFQIFPIFWA